MCCRQLLFPCYLGKRETHMGRVPNVHFTWLIMIHLSLKLVATYGKLHCSLNSQILNSPFIYIFKNENEYVLSMEMEMEMKRDAVESNTNDSELQRVGNEDSLGFE